MTKAELFEEIRAILAEALQDTVETPWVYDDPTLERAARSAIRHLKAVGVKSSVEMSSTGVLSPEPTGEVGLLLAYFVVARLLSGDLAKKLNDGELGLNFKAGLDVIDTRDAGKQLASLARHMEEKVEFHITLLLTNGTSGFGQVYGGATPGRLE